MGGKKGPEKNRKYEKDRRDRFNEQFVELHKLLPDFNSCSAKATKAEIIAKTIQFLKDTQLQTHKLEGEFESEKMKVNELQKKVSGLLQIIKELIKLLHKSNIRFPSSLPVDDFKTFQDVFAKSKKQMKNSTVDNKENVDSDNAIASSDSECDEKSMSSVIPAETVNKTDEIAASTTNTSISPPASSVETSCSTQVTSLEQPKTLGLNSNTLILPSGNLFAINGVQNTVVDYCNTNPPLIVNKQFAVPTLILMQNNFVPVNTVQHIAVSQRTQKLIMPKQTINTTKTTFINKKPIPTVRLYKSTTKDNTRKSATPRRRHSRRSKGILVKYPKRKPPTKTKKKEVRPKKLVKHSKSISNENEITDKNENFTAPATSYQGNSDDVDKTYSCSDSILNTPDIPSTGQFIDFFDNHSSRCLDNEVANNTSAEFSQSNEILKSEKSQIESFGTNAFERSFATSDLGCNLIESHKEKESSKESNHVCVNSNNEKNPNFIQTPLTNDSLLINYVPNIEKNYAPANTENSTPDNAVILEKQKPTEKEIAPVRSSSKDLNLSLMDDKKHYESSFDEFSNDLFTSLQVPASGHNADSISPTAAFLQTFPLVSSGPNVDLLPEQEEDSAATTTSTTILQIGNLESPSTMLFSSKSVNRENNSKVVVSDTATSFSSYCAANLELESARKEKKDACKENISQQSFNLSDVSNFSNQLKTSSCAKDSISQNMSFYPTPTTTTFSSYNIFTKYNDIPPPVTCSYYSLCSQPFSAPKTADPVSDFNSWIPSTYNQDDSNKEKTKRDKCSVAFRSTSEFGPLTSDNSGDRSKNKKHKSGNTRPLVNWMTSPDLRNVPDTNQSTDTFPVPKEDASNLNSFLGTSTSNNSNFNAYSGGEYFLDGQNFADPQLTSCKMAYSSANPTNYSWSPSKSTLPLPADTHSMIIPSTLPTLVGDLALGNTSSFNNYDLMGTKKSETDKKKPCKNYCKNTSTTNSSSFLSVTQLVDDKSIEKTTKKCPLDVPACNFVEEQREKCNYPVTHKPNESMDYVSKKNYSNTCKDTKTQHVKCKKDAIKYQVPRCVSKENKKDTRPKPYNDYTMQHCLVQNKEVAPLSSKNSNYSAESLISSSNQNTCSTTGYFPYENTSSYGNCSTNDYVKKRVEETEPLANVGYYTNTNYVYHNNFQSFNNYGFSNQCYNNYSNQIQPSSFHKKKDDAYKPSQDTTAAATEWSLSSYNPIVQTDFSNSQKIDSKCKQSFANKYHHHVQKNNNSINSEMYNKYYQSGSASSSLTQSKSNCTFNSTSYSFNQSGGQYCADSNCLTPSYDMKSIRNSNGVNSSTVHSATTLTNFNLSTIFPEMNDKQCTPNRVNTTINEKNDPKYNKGNVDEINYNYLLQPAVESNTDHLFGPSSFQLHNFTDFSSRKMHK